MGRKKNVYAENTKNQTKAKPIHTRIKSVQCEIKSLQLRKFTFCKQGCMLMDEITRKEFSQMKTAVIYARYSSERQTEQSIEGQIRECAGVTTF